MQLLENYHRQQNYQVSVRGRNEADFRHHSFGGHLGYFPVALPAAVTHNAGYLLGLKYEYYNETKKFPVLQFNFDYINLQYYQFESTGVRMKREFFGMKQLQVLIGPKHDFFQSKEDFSLYVRAAVGFCRRTYLYQFERFQMEPQFDGSVVYTSLGFVSARIKEDNFIGNFGTGITYKNLSLDVGVERVTYSFLLQSYAPVVRLGYQFDWW